MATCNCGGPPPWEHSSDCPANPYYKAYHKVGKQTWWGSIVEAKTNIAIGFGVAYVSNIIILPAFGYPVTAGDTFWITCVFTVISVIRQLVVRRFFNNLKWGHHKS